MNPEQSPTPFPGSGNYDFIMNPVPPKRGLSLGNKPFIVKLVMIIGGAVVLIIVVTVIINVFFSTKTNTDALVAVTQSEQEIIRLSAEGKSAADQAIKNAAISTEVSIDTQQHQWVTYLEKQGRKVENAELAAKKNEDTDKKLTTAKQTSTFDETYTLVMRSQLETYAGLLKSAQNTAVSDAERALLETHQRQVDLLLQQWPT